MPIQSINRAIDILLSFSQAKPWLGITEISKTLGLNKATVFGLISTLQQKGFLTKDPVNHKYGLGNKLHELGTIQVWNTRLYQVGVYPAHRLSEKLSRSVRLFLWEKESLSLILNVFHSSSQFPFGGPVGANFPAYCTAAGKAVLAWLPAAQLRDFLNHTQLYRHTSKTITERKRLEQELRRIREKGFSTDREEFLNGFSCMGMPILDFSSQPVGAVSFSVDKEFFESKEAISASRELKFTSTEISLSMGYAFDVERASWPARGNK